MNELPISFHRKKIPIFAFIISQMRRLNDEWQFPTHWFWPLVNGDNHAYGEPASSPPVGHPATPHHHRTCRHLFIWPTWSGHLSTSSCALCPLQSWPMFHAPSVSHRGCPTPPIYMWGAPLDICLCFKTRLTHTLSVLLSRGVSKHDCGPHSDSEVCLVSVSDALLAETPIPPTPPMRLATQARVSIFSPDNSSNTCALRGAQLISWMQSHIYECIIWLVSHPQ